MPLHTSPIDGAPMRTIRRYGIEIDICPTSGGIWLDRGELEKLVEIIEINDHPWFVAVQYHPEFKSKPTQAHPLFRGFVEAAINRRLAEKQGTSVPV